MTYWPYKNSEGKNKKITRALATVNYGRTYGRPVFLPGPQLGCILEAIDNGIIAVDTEVVLAESYPKLRAGIRQQADRLEINYQMIEDDITKVDLVNVDGTGNLVDYMFLDMCGAVSPQLLYWLQTSARRWLSPTARIAFTFYAAPRHRRQFCEDALAAHNNKLPAGLDRMLRNSENNWVDKIVLPGDPSTMPAATFMRAQYLMIAEALPYEFRLYQTHAYQDQRLPMVFFHGELTGNANPCFPGKLKMATDERWKKHIRPLRPIDVGACAWKHHPLNLRRRVSVGLRRRVSASRCYPALNSLEN